MVPGEVKMSSKRYPEEFKIEAARQIVDQGYSVAAGGIRGTSGDPEIKERT